MELFPFLNNLYDKKIPIRDVEFKEHFMAIKFLSLYPGTFTLAMIANQLCGKIPGDMLSAFLFHSIPKQRAPKFAYPKGAEKEKVWPEEAIRKVSNQFCCSAEHAIQTLNILEVQQSENILETLGIDPKKGKEKKRGNETD